MELSPQLKHQVARVWKQPEQTKQDRWRDIWESFFIALIALACTTTFVYVSERRVLRLDQPVTGFYIGSVHLTLIPEWSFKVDGGLLRVQPLYVSMEQTLLACCFIAGWLPTLLNFRRKAVDDDAIDDLIKLERVRWPGQFSMSLVIGALIVDIIILIDRLILHTSGLSPSSHLLIILGSTILCSAAAGIIAYIMLFVTRLIWSLLVGGFLAIGLLTAVSFAPDGKWLTDSVSYLGYIASSYQVFTSTIAIAGIGLIVFTHDLLYDLRVLGTLAPSGKYVKLEVPHLEVFGLCFLLIGSGLLGIAFFPINTHPLVSLLHSISAWGLVGIVALFLMIGISYFLPDRRFAKLRRISIGIGIFCVVVVILWAVVDPAKVDHFAYLEMLLGFVVMIWLVITQNVITGIANKWKEEKLDDAQRNEMAKKQE